MLLQGYEINITANSVDVKEDDSNRSVKSRFYGSLVLFAIAVILVYFMVFTSRSGHSAWWNLINMPRDSGDFSSAVLEATIAALLSGSFLLAGVANFFPSGEALHCDRSTFMSSTIPWFNFHGRWTTRAFPIADVSQLRFAVWRGARGSTTSCIRYFADGKMRKLFIGLEAPEASHILKGLKNLGADVVDDPEMLSKIQETLRERRSRLSINS